MTDTIIYRDADGDVIYAACVGCEFYKGCVESSITEDEAPCQAHPRKRRKRREK